jgi:hypothetical protein
MHLLSSLLFQYSVYVQRLKRVQIMEYIFFKIWYFICTVVSMFHEFVCYTLALFPTTAQLVLRSYVFRLPIAAIFREL